MADIEFSTFGGCFRMTDGSAYPARDLKAHQPPNHPIAASDLVAPAIIGIASLMLKPHFGKNGIEVFNKGAFASSLCAGKCIRTLLMHEESELLATTSDGLELLADERNLMFKLLLPHSEIGREAGRLIASGAYSECSVGYIVKTDHMETLDGDNFRMIDDVDLAEISIVKKGAVPGTICHLIEGRDVHSLRDHVKSGQFHQAIAEQRMTLALKTLPDRLAARLAA